MRVKVTVNRIETHEYASGYIMRKAIFSTVLDQTTSPELRFQIGPQPIGEMVMQLDNPIAIATFRPGKKFVVEFNEAE